MYEVLFLCLQKKKNLLIFINKKIRSTGISPSYEEMKKFTQPEVEIWDT